jgi:hypothetical protein
MHTGSILAMMFNNNRTNSSPAKTVFDYHPYLDRPKRVPTADEVERIFSGGGKCPVPQSEQAKQ